MVKGATTAGHKGTTRENAHTQKGKEKEEQELMNLQKTTKTKKKKQRCS